MTHPSKYLIIAAIALAGFGLASDSNAQGFKFYGQNPFSFGGGFSHDHSNVQPAFAELSKNVYAIDTLADQMAFKFGWEYRKNGGSSESEALYKQMKTHARLTNNLIKAYKGESASSFQRAANEVYSSTKTLQALRDRVKISNTVCTLIDQTVPLAEHVYRNSDNFQTASARAAAKSENG